ncbi:molybdopterin molybdotransferase MoeA [Hyphobacterium sp. CCMP332]|uniref:molybdopterin molybdotransferase MoeA n=1 Tax=Hyphobacterium sp. CCMP332 TaxID=2749086 RepID=UPI00164F912B|nr:gephyrin-like molybdotransferase Glp [Hyphobacterium sp. CCMP332]QNL19649.1 molybdopterin molybdotransferase MoeA [Hyphobacterium sp. CCMP332]
MIALDDAIALIRDRIQPLGAETVPLGAAHRRWLAAPVIAARTQPPFDASAMDGYAVRSADLTGWDIRLDLRGESAAGHASHHAVGAGGAFRISTGARLPAGADQVVIQENCRKAEGGITTAEAPHPGAHIRRAGIDFMTGDTLLEPGQSMTPAAMSLAASAGHSALSVSRQPIVGLLSTGDELVEIGAAAGPDQIINSLGPGLTALVQAWGGLPRYLGIARDDVVDVREKLRAAEGLDLLVTIGGASVGDHDHLRRVFGELGGELFFEKIAIKPGKPTWFGRLGSTPVLGLPGNPVSAMVMARLCLKPAMDRLLGSENPALFLSAQLGIDLPANGPRENMIRAHFDAATGQIAPLDNQDSSALSALVASNALIRRPAEAPAASAGESVSFLPLDAG